MKMTARASVIWITHLIADHLAILGIVDVLNTDVECQFSAYKLVLWRLLLTKVWAVTISCKTGRCLANYQTSTKGLSFIRYFILSSILTNSGSEWAEKWARIRTSRRHEMKRSGANVRILKKVIFIANMHD